MNNLMMSLFKFICQKVFLVQTLTGYHIRKLKRGSFWFFEFSTKKWKFAKKFANSAKVSNRSRDTKNFCSEERMHIPCHLQNAFFNRSLAAPRPTLGYCRRNSLTHPKLMASFCSDFGPKVTENLATRLDP